MADDYENDPDECPTSTAGGELRAPTLPPPSNKKPPQKATVEPPSASRSTRKRKAVNYREREEEHDEEGGTTGTESEGSGDDDEDGEEPFNWLAQWEPGTLPPPAPRRGAPSKKKKKRSSKLAMEFTSGSEDRAAKKAEIEEALAAFKLAKDKGWVLTCRAATRMNVTEE